MTGPVNHMSKSSLQPDTRDRINDLAVKGEIQRWQPATLIGGGEDITVPRLMPKRLYAAIISQFLHGERATAKLCRRLIGAIDDPVVHRFLATQIADETRHAEAYARYLDHLGGARAVDANFGQALNQALEWSGPPQAWMLGFHVLLEGEALRTLADFQEFWPCPVFRRMNALISRDGARHVDFGKLFLRDTLPRMAAAERRAIYHQLDVFWRDVGGGLLADTWVPGIFTRGLRQRWLDDGWRHHCRAFADVGLLPSRQISEGAAA
jgi:hypothetical protein